MVYLILYTYDMTPLSWDVRNHKEMGGGQGGLLRLNVGTTHGRVMFSSTVGVTLMGLPDAETETERLSAYPNVVTSFTNRNLYTGADGTLIHSYTDTADNRPILGAFDRAGAGNSTSSASGVGADSSGTTRQVWWREVTLEGSLFDLNRALAVVTYWPDLNWNSGGSGGSPLPQVGVMS
jgi:hypothetical protein